MRILLFGTFDDLHPGHHYLLNAAVERMKQSEKREARSGESVVNGLWISVSRDTNVLRIKGRAPLQTEEVRAAALRAAFPEATVMLGDHTDFLAPIRLVKPDLILLGYDQHLPPGISDDMLGVPTERVGSFFPHIHKSSIRRKNAGKG